MKKLLFTTTAILFLGIFNQATAQFGLRAGLNVAGFTTSEEFDLDNKLGLNGGVFYEHMLSESLYLRPAFLFSMKGAGSEVEFGEFSSTNTINFSYVEVPLDIVYKIPLGENSFNINAGPYLGLLLGANSKTEYNDGTSFEEEDIKDDVTGMDFGLNIGAEFQLSKIGIGVGYGLGLTNLVADAEDDESIKNKNITVYLTYRL